MSDDPTKELPTPQQTLDELRRRVEVLEVTVDQKIRQMTPLSAQLTELKEYLAARFGEIFEWHTRMEERQTRTEEWQVRMEERQTRMEMRVDAIEKEVREIGRTMRRITSTSPLPCGTRTTSMIG